MNLVILSRNSSLYSTKSLFLAAKYKNHNVRVLDYVDCDLIIEENQLMVSFRGKLLTDVDAIIPRIGTGWTGYGAAVIRQFESQNVFTTLGSKALIHARNKLVCSQILAKHNIPVPRTVISNNSSAYNALLDQFDGDQVVIKLINSTHGVGVLLARKDQQARHILETFTRSNQKSLIQEFIKEANGSDIRILVVDNKIVGAMKRQARAGEFRSNLHQGGSSFVESITSEEEELAIRAVQALELNVAGVDMLRSDRGPLILEVNASPGLEGIEKTTGNDISSEIIAFIERHVIK